MAEVDDDGGDAGLWEYAPSSGLTREQEIADRMAHNPNEIARRVHWCILQAVRSLDIEPDAGRSVVETLDLILARALPGRLDPGLYALVWQLRSAPSAEKSE